jgi:dihydrolipoamide dehydrogenase
MVAHASFSATPTAQQVRRIIHRRKGIRLRSLRLSTDLRQDLGFDTLDLVDIILELERTFQLTIPDEVPLYTVDDLAHYVTDHRGEAAAAKGLRLNYPNQPGRPRPCFPFRIMETHYQLVVIGSGPGGYTAAIRAAQLGYRVALVEKYPVLGGTCTNVGCIPAKALLDSTEHYAQARHQFAAHGIEVTGLHINFPQLMHRRDEVVRKNNEGLAYLMRKNTIAVISGTAGFVDATTVRVTATDGAESLLRADYFVVATGSKPASLPGVVVDKQRIITSTEALRLPALPRSMVVIGGGVIGVEMASTYARLGTEVTVIEYTDSLIPTMDRELGRTLQKVLTKLGIRLLLGSKVQAATSTGSEATVSILDSSGASQQLTADYCLVAVGRRAYTDGLNLTAAGVEVDARGQVVVNELLQTCVSHIYALGDVVRGAMLAHKAEDEGVFVAEVINGQKPHLKYHLIPNVVYTWPEVASVGSTEEELKAAGTPYRVGKFPFQASGRARASMDTEGFAKVLSSPRYGEILGVHIIGARAADLIAQAVVAMEYEVTDADMGRISYAHPTYAEALKEAYLMASGQGALNL